MIFQAVLQQALAEQLRQQGRLRPQHVQADAMPRCRFSPYADPRWRYPPTASNRAFCFYTANFFVILSSFLEALGTIVGFGHCSITATPGKHARDQVMNRSQIQAVMHPSQTFDN